MVASISVRDTVKELHAHAQTRTNLNKIRLERQTPAKSLAAIRFLRILRVLRIVRVLRIFEHIWVVHWILRKLDKPNFWIDRHLPIDLIVVHSLLRNPCSERSGVHEFKVDWKVWTAVRLPRLLQNAVWH